MNYKERLESLGLESLEMRKVMLDLLEVFKIVKSKSHLRFDEFF